MKNTENYIEDIAEIRKIMEKSSKFISLSGLSGVSAGIVALIGAAFTFYYLDFDERYFNTDLYFIKGLYQKLNSSALLLILEGIVLLVLAIGLSYFFTKRRALKNSTPIWNTITKRLLINLFIPLVAGGIFCLLLIFHQLFYLIAPVTLIFYGLGLINASKYTLDEIRYLGVSEIILGLIATFLIGYGLIFWAVGFGILHIIYGIYMYSKYEKVN